MIARRSGPEHAPCGITRARKNRRLRRSLGETRALLLRLFFAAFGLFQPAPMMGFSSKEPDATSVIVGKDCSVDDVLVLEPQRVADEIARIADATADPYFVHGHRRPPQRCRPNLVAVRGADRARRSRPAAAAVPERGGDEDEHQREARGRVAAGVARAAA